MVLTEWNVIMPKLFNMSITGGIIILVVLVVRLCLKRAPKIFSYALWIVVLVRLLCPVSISSAVSVLNLFSQKTVKSGRMEYIPEQFRKYDHPLQILNNTMPDVDTAKNEVKSPDNTSQSFRSRLGSLSTITFYAFALFIWLVGVSAMLIYGNVQYVWLKERLVGAMHLHDNIYIADHIDSPFVMGMIKPKIYLPSSLSDAERGYIILHEQHHIKRFDHITRIIAFLALCIHWFNPLVWVAFVLSGTDMEMSCDEAVMKKIGEDIRESYSLSLISLTTGRRIISGTPLAFGEGSTKSRIKNVMRYKKPAFWVMILAVITCIITSGCVLTNPSKDDKTTSDEINNENDITDINNANENNHENDDNTYLPAEIITEDPNSVENKDINSLPLSKQQLAIRDAIIRHNYSRSMYPADYDIPCASFINFATMTTDMESDTISEINTYYGLALYEQFKAEDNKIEVYSGSHVPVVLTFEIDKSGEYNLTEYWEPRDGNYYAEDIYEKFPDETADEALNLQKYILPQQIECYAQAVEETGVDTDKIIEDLIFKALIDSQMSVFDLAQSVFENYPLFSSEHKEMLHYGFYTLKYCFERLEDNDENGSGYFMMTVCKDIAEAMGEEPLAYNISTDGTTTGRQMYEIFKNNAISLLDKYPETELAEKYPASYYLLKLLGIIKPATPNTVITHEYIPQYDYKAPADTVLHICSAGYANRHTNYYFYYRNDKPVKAEYIASIKGTPDEIEAKKTAFIKGLMGENIWLDDVEWVQVPSDRADELKITDEDAPGGFYIYNEDFLADVYRVSNSCKITAADLRMNSGNMTEMSLSQFTDMFNEIGDFKEDMAFQIIIENGEVVEIAQRYLP